VSETADFPLCTITDIHEAHTLFMLPTGTLVTCEGRDAPLYTEPPPLPLGKGPDDVPKGGLPPREW
jgi:hypothetical protein